MTRPPARSPRPIALARVLAAVFIGALALVGPTTARAAEPVATTEGIDISHWQGEIDWTQVAAAGKRFAFMKATEDVDYTDPTYGLNRARALAASLLVGAYHYAQPDTAVGDAVAEADHFLSYAVLAEGDLPPVLDLEERNGMTDAALEAWVRAYLERIHERTGVRGLVYTSPNFWDSYVGGSEWFATNGYRAVWVAHWTTASAPTVPAADWAGFGWTFWQYTSSGTVAGISGRVDLDRFAGTDLTPVLIDPAGEETDSAPPAPPFRDIGSSTFEADIAWLFAEGITSGCSPTRFCPDGQVSRGQMASFLARALQLPSTKKDFFVDDTGSKHEDAINRLARAGLTSGCAAGRYCPNELVSRGQLASFLSRVLDLSRSPKDFFRDDERSTHESNINRIARAGLTKGCTTTRYCPDGVLTRGQMAAFLHRTFGT